MYMNTEVSMELRLFHEYCDTHGAAVVEEQYESNPIWSPESTLEQRHAFRQMVFSQGMSRVFEDYSRSLESLRSRNAAFLGHNGNSMHHAQPAAPLSSIADSGIAVDSQSSPRDSGSRRHASSQLPSPSQLSAPGQLPTQSQLSAPGQPPVVFDNGGPSNLIPPHDEMPPYYEIPMHDEMPQGQGYNPQDFSNDLFDMNGYLQI